MTVLLAGLGAIVLLAIWFVALIMPVNARVAALGLELEVARQEQQTLEDAIERLKAIKANELAYVAALGEMSASVPATPDAQSFLVQLHDLERDTGIDWLSITLGAPSASTEIEGLSVVPVNMTIDGQYFEALGYLYGLEDLERLVVVKTISVSSSQDADGFTRLSIQLTGEIYTNGTYGLPAVEDVEETETEESDANA